MAVSESVFRPAGDFDKKATHPLVRPALSLDDGTAGAVLPCHRSIWFSPHFGESRLPAADAHFGSIFLPDWNPTNRSLHSPPVAPGA
jgi:hypothetical protein